MGDLFTRFPITQQNLHASENVVSFITYLFSSVGIGVGSLLCRKIGGREININMVPYGAIGLTQYLLCIWRQALLLCLNAQATAFIKRYVYRWYGVLPCHACRDFTGN